ncbi:MAG: response regulator [Vulcanimicrobiota bacterium]
MKHRLLLRQLRKAGLDPEQLPSDPAAWRAFLERVEGAYQDTDNERYKMRRSLDTSSREMRELYEHLLEARQQAEAASQAKGIFLAQMSHEIRTPMNGVLGMASLLARTRLDEEQRHYLEVIQSSAETLLTVINDVLDFSKVEAGKLELVESRFSLRDNVETVCSLLAERAHQRGIELACLVYRNVPDTLVGDPDRLRQVLTNLVGNAVKFTEQGEVVLRIKSVQLEGESIQLRIEVSDTGPGIPEELCDKIFNPFEQADPTTTRRFGGTGLGLPICRHLVELMGGELGVRSVVGEGSTFWFTAAFGVADPEPQEAQEAEELFGLRVLLIDDNETNRLILREQLSDWEMVTKEAAEGGAGLAELRKAAGRGLPFDLVILDMQMPEIDGLEVARQIRADEALARTRIILLTSVGHEQWKDEIEHLAIDACHQKPIRRDALFRCIRKVMGQRPTVVADPDKPVRFQGEVLLVEDNDFNQQVAVGLLRKLGLNTTLADDGQAALDLLWSKDFDLILMDCQMPGIDGYECTREIRKRESGHKRSVIVAMTAHALTGDRERCLAAGMDDYLSKPITLEKLSAALAQWLPIEEKSMSADQTPGHPALDNHVFAAICELRRQNIEAGLGDVFDTFFKNLDRLRDDLIQAVEKRDLFTFREALHSLKGSAGNLGAIELYRLCEQTPTDAIPPGFVAQLEAASQRLHQAVFSQA